MHRIAYARIGEHPDEQDFMTWRGGNCRITGPSARMWWPSQSSVSSPNRTRQPISYLGKEMTLPVAK